MISRRSALLRATPGLTRPISQAANHPPSRSKEHRPEPSKYTPQTYDMHPFYSAETHTMELPSISLPASPIMSPAWRETQRHFLAPKQRNRPPQSRLERLFSRNIYAHMLASPIRLDPMTQAVLPRAFLASFVVTGSKGTKGNAWWVPEVERIPDWRSKEQKEEIVELREREHEDTSDETKEMKLEEPEEPEKKETVLPFGDLSPEDPEYIPTPRIPGAPTTPVSASAPKTPSSLTTLETTANLVPHLRVYTHLSHTHITNLTSRIAGPLRQSSLLAMRRANHQSWLTGQSPVWRQGMADVYLSLLRDRVIEDFRILVEPERLGRKESPGPSAFVHLNNLAEIRQKTPEKVLRGAILSTCLTPLPQKVHHFPDLAYNDTVPIHHLPNLLGPEHMATLLSIVPELGETPYTLVIRPKAMHLRMRLWKLEGYLAKPGMKLDIPKRQPKERVVQEVEGSEEVEEHDGSEEDIIQQQVPQEPEEAQTMTSPAPPISEQPPMPEEPPKPTRVRRAKRKIEIF